MIMAIINHKVKLFFLAFLLILSCVVLVNLNTLNNPFLWDDNTLVVSNPLIKGWHFLGKVFTSDLFYGSTTGSNFYRPMQTLSYLLDYQFWQLDPKGYHITNIFLHSFASFLVLLFTYFLVGNAAISFASSLLFAVCPVHTEAVSYISGRTDMLMAIFLLLSFFLFIKKETAQGKRKITFFLLSLISFILGLLSKELAMVFPLAILSYLFYFARDKLKKTPYLIKNVLPFFIISMLFIILRLYFLEFATLRPPALTQFPFLLRITVLPKVLFTYIGLLVFPVNLHMSRELIRPTTFLGFFIAWFALGSLVVACSYLLRYKEKQKRRAFLLSWFLIFILPQSGLIAINAFVAEHFIYLSSISFFVAVSYLLHKHLRKRLFKFSLACLLVYYGLLTISSNFQWQDPVTFYGRIIKFSPGSFQAHNNLGLQYEYRHLYDKAMNEYQKALEIKPDLLEAHSNIANLYFKMGKPQEAKRIYALVEKTAPGSKAGELQNNIAAVYEVEGLWEEALNRYQRALQLDPKLNFTRFNIARIYFSKGKIDLAAIEILNSLSQTAISSEKSKARLKLIEDYLVSEKNMNYSVPFYNELGIKLAHADFFDEAIAAFQRVLELEPRYADAHFNLGLAYWKKGLKNEAALEFRSALKIDPHHDRAKAFLSEIKKGSFLYKILH